MGLTVRVVLIALSLLCLSQVGIGQVVLPGSCKDHPVVQNFRAADVSLISSKSEMKSY